MSRDKADKTHAAKSAIHAADEWGIPDWRDATAYGNVSRWTSNRWRWEFYRRREDLRAFFDRWANDPEVRNLRCNEGRQPNEQRFLAFGCGDEKGDAIRCFGYCGVPNPRIGDQPAMSIMPADQIFHKFRFYNPSTRPPPGFSVREAMGENPPRVYDLTLKDHEYAIKFDLNKPLLSQVKEATETLKAAQIKLHGKTVHRNSKKGMWLAHLRTLDARASLPAKASWSALTEVLYEAGLVDRHKNPEGGYCAPPPQAGRDKWKGANALRFNF